MQSPRSTKRRPGRRIRQRAKSGECEEGDLSGETRHSTRDDATGAPMRAQGRTKFIIKRRENHMKKMLIPGCTVLFLALVLLLSCATLPAKPITQADLPDLKGKWKGFYQYRGVSYTTVTLAVE